MDGPTIALYVGSLLTLMAAIGVLRGQGRRWVNVLASLVYTIGTLSAVVLASGWPLLGAWAIALALQYPDYKKAHAKEDTGND